MKIGLSRSKTVRSKLTVDLRDDTTNEIKIYGLM